MGRRERRKRRFLERIVENRVAAMRAENPEASEDEIYQFTLDDLEDRFADRPFLQLLIEILIELFLSRVGS